MKLHKALALLLALVLAVSLASVGFAAEDRSIHIGNLDKIRQNAVPAGALPHFPGQNEIMTASNPTVLPHMAEVDRGILRNADTTLHCFFSAGNCGTKDTAFGMVILTDDDDEDLIFEKWYYFDPGDCAGMASFEIPAGTFPTTGTYNVFFAISTVVGGDLDDVLQGTYYTVTVADQEVGLNRLQLLDVDSKSYTVINLVQGDVKEYIIAFDPVTYTGDHTVAAAVSNGDVVQMQEMAGIYQLTAKAPGVSDLQFTCGNVQLTVRVNVSPVVNVLYVSDRSLQLCDSKDDILFFDTDPAGLVPFVEALIADPEVVQITGRDNESGCLWLRGLKPGNTTLTLRCGSASQEVPISVGHHEMTVLEDTPATCTEPGKRVTGCAYCSDRNTEYFPALGHELNPGSVTEFQEPTATQPGYLAGHCTRCDQDVREELHPIFIDTVADSFYAKELDYLYANGIIKGMTENTFGPGNPINRGQLVVLLYRLSGETAGEAENPFVDVSSDSFVYDAVRWASANGIANGYGDGTFLPGQPVTRAEMVTFIYRFAAHMGADMSAAADLTGYTDVDQMLPYAKTPFAWAVATGLIKGTSEVTLGPSETANRAQCAVILYRYVKAFPSVVG